MKKTSKTFTVNFISLALVSIEALTESIQGLSARTNIHPDNIDFSLTTSESFFTEIKLHEIRELFNSNLSKSESLGVMLTSGELVANLYFFIGSWVPEHTGSISILNASDEVCQSLSAYFAEELKLTINKPLTSDDIYKGYITINPVYSDRNFASTWDSVFVLMPFSLSWSEHLWEELRSFGTMNDIKIKRADDLYGQDVIEDIWKGIRDSLCVIAELTSINLNVFYELGIAHTMGKQVILISRDIDSLPEIFKKFRTVSYSISEEGLAKLFNELKPMINESYLPKN